MKRDKKKDIDVLEDIVLPIFATIFAIIVVYFSALLS